MTTKTLNTQFAHGHASASDWRHALERCLEQCHLPAPDARLGFVYATDHFAKDFGDIRAQLLARTGIRHWIGTVGVGICASGKEYFDEPALAVMLCDFDERHFALVPTLKSVRDASLTPIVCRGGAANFAVVHADAATQDLALIIRELARKLESGFVVGGLTSSRTLSPQIAGETLSGGLSGVVFSDEVVLATRLTQGCAPIGPRRTITRAHRNIVVTLDGRPALEVLQEDTGSADANSLRGMAQHVFAGLPVKGSDTDDYIVRHLAGVDVSRKLVALTEIVAEGDSLFFCTRDKGSACDDLERMLRSIKSGLYRAPRGALYFSCLGRGPNLFGDDSEELRIIRDHLGEVPLVGFFGNGEISHNRLYGYTGVLTVFFYWAPPKITKMGRSRSCAALCTTRTRPLLESTSTHFGDF